MSDERHERDAFENETARLIADAMEAELPGAPYAVWIHWFDAVVTIEHDPSSTPDPALGYRLARHLRGGRDVSRTAPTDWHLRGTETGPLSPESKRHGTSLSLSRTFAIPPDYSEEPTTDRKP